MAAAPAMGVCQGDFAGFAAIRTIVEAVGTKADVELALADGAVTLTGAAALGQVALRADSRLFHR